ncbi:hypothetical protein MIND_00882800 [Mycena indigotica]|uniref:L domain-like protein n=1 Tax=Mycena indigotica TaxID=2126181 RepID=A0A8H6SIM1_9AGAR|nr:uncharacterized protein MIND_00882800 [Mycena indigotica]KAF7299336.1 hypothetical protein MIND_00882800 [Mycena indigotica]
MDTDEHEHDDERGGERGGAGERRPAWQTEELGEEWVDVEPEEGDGDGEEGEDGESGEGTRSVSLTEPLPSHIVSSTDSPGGGGTAPFGVGTFLVREDRAPAVLPKTPGRGRSAGMKDFFSPLPLERMFEPPTPPLPPVPMPPVSEEGSSGEEVLETDLPMVSFHGHGRRRSLDCRFTHPSNNHGNNGPATDPRLRLFQFTYDTFTREHLSALADSIAVNTPSGPAAPRLAPVSEDSPSFSDLRSTKRVKLSPPGEYGHVYGEGAGANASIARPRVLGKAYVGESRSLMEKIRQARDFSTVSTVVSEANEESKYSALEQLRRPSLLTVPDKDNNNKTSPTTTTTTTTNTPTPTPAPYSSSTYRQQAAALMAQIKSDMKGTKRIFSGDTDADVSRVTAEVSFDKENFTPRHARRVSSSSKTRASPRRGGREGKEALLAAEMARLDIARRRQAAFVPAQPVSIVVQPALLGPPGHAPPGGHVTGGGPGAHVQEDLRRFVSSSTASGTGTETGTTLTAGSYVKHAGPPVPPAIAKHAGIRTIAPGDVPVLPERMGDMWFDRGMMRWVRSVQAAGGGEGGEGAQEGESEDVFGDIESLRDSRDDEEGDEGEEGMTSFETDGGVVPVMTGVGSIRAGEGDETTDSEDVNDAVDGGLLADYAQEGESGSGSEEGEEDTQRPALHHHQPQADESVTGAFLPPPVVLRTFSPPASATKTPAKSALKTPGASTPGPAFTPGPANRERDRYTTPQQQPARRAHRRSVSFSDGKRDGPIRGLVESSSVGGGGQPSVRSKRIAAMFVGAEDSEEEEEDEHHDEDDDVQDNADDNEDASGVSTSTPRRAFSRTHAQRADALPHGTFLTECSFGVAHDRLVAVLTDVEPFEPHWEALPALDLAGKGLESVARLKEFVPGLDALNLNGNALAWLSGVPGGVRTLAVASNRLTGVTSYSHLLNLENLDISRNEVESLSQLACLRHLRELRADGNGVRSLEGLEGLDGLVKLSLAKNKLRALDVRAARVRWTRLEVLDVSGNALRRVAGLGGLQALVVLNLEDNELGALDVAEGGPGMGRLRVLRASGNRIAPGALGVAGLGGLRTLYVDGNALRGDELLGDGGGRPLRSLENLSIRSQRGGALRMDVGAVRDAKRLYLSGNTLPATFLSTPCYNLVYLEAARCGLTALPRDLAALAPNLRALNLNYNFLGELAPLVGLTRLRKLSVVGARLKETKEVIRAVRGLPAVEVLDFRMNPCTLGWYLPLLLDTHASDPDEKGQENGQDTWAERDARFRRGLPDAAYVGRLAYRGLVMRAAGALRVLDGVPAAAKERAKSEAVLGLMRA